MDLQALSDMNSVLTDNLNRMKKINEEKKNSYVNSTKNQKTNDIVLSRKGDSGYVKNFDVNNDGEITLEEFNQYCEENGVNEKEKLKILSLMSGAKTSSKLIDKTSKNEKKETTQDKLDGAIYARKGDDKYNEVMDTDKNDVVTYKEYIEYCNKRAKDSENNSDKSKAEQAYSKTEQFNEEEEFSVEAEV